MVTLSLPSGDVTQVSPEDYDRVNSQKWHRNGRTRGGPYVKAYRVGDKFGVLLHRFILNVLESPEVLVDHIDGDGMNNQRSNLRLASAQQNARNKSTHSTSKLTSIFKGVDRPAGGRWRARIMNNRKYNHIGMYDREIEAALAYDEAARKIFGDFAKFNFEVSNVH